MAGRKKIPSNLHLLRGNPSKLPQSSFQDEPQPKVPSEVPKPPTILKGDKEARKKWKQIVPELMDLGLFTELETDIIAHYCQLFSRLTEITRRLNEIERDENGNIKDTLINVSPTGYAQQSALIGMQNVTQREMRAIMVEFGMTPSSRSRLKVQPKKKENKLEVLRKRGKN
jgi:P27 family predicted phage terminase small subunit